ncbi:MAG: hypothetical protein Q4D91_07220 [Lautropia sp.]|nr:hypothetical protein [Lautropia sp.]
MSNYNSRVRPPAPPITILPGALLPEDWLRTEHMQARLPAIGAALAEGRLQMMEAQLPPITAASAPVPVHTGHMQPGLPEPAAASSPDAFASSPPPLWAHHRWLAALPAISALQPGIGTLSAAACLLPAVEGPPGLSVNADGHAWLMRPVNFRLTTDSMLMDAMLPARLDHTGATRLVDAIRPLLADEGYEIELLSPTTWLLKLRPGMTGWQLQTSAFEATVGQHIDAHLPQGPDARRFRRLLNEIQMSWHQETRHDDSELPANAVWLDGPISPALSNTLACLTVDGLRRNELFFLPRLYQDLGSWLDQLAQLDQQYAQHQQQANADAPFACLLCGEYQARWLYEPAAANLLLAWQASAAGHRDHTGSHSDSRHAAAAFGTDRGEQRSASQPSPGLQPAASQAAPSDLPTPPGLFRLMGELLSPRAAWQALRERLAATRHPARAAAGSAPPTATASNPTEHMLHKLLSEAPPTA